MTADVVAPRRRIAALLLLLGVLVLGTSMIVAYLARTVCGRWRAWA